jgi:hypothetical protein
MVFSPFQTIKRIKADPDESVKLYPVPAKDEVNLDLNHLGSATAWVTISDIQGKVYYHGLGRANTPNKISVSELPNGLYTVNVKNSILNLNRKLVVAR